MKFVKGLMSIAAISAVAVLSHVGSAQAISFNITRGVAGPGGVTNQGAYSDYFQKEGTTTIDFNSGSAPTTGFATYSFENGNISSVRADRWAPAGESGQINEGTYLAVFEGDKVTIELEKVLNYFGMNWGAMSKGNTFSFFNGKNLIQTITYSDVNPVAPVQAEQHYGEGNGYLHFYADNENQFFDRIVISQVGGGGFESDNHSFHLASKGDPRAVPEPAAILGLTAIGGAFLLKRKKQVQTEE